MSKTPIKSNLFSFVTLRSPQAVGDNNAKSKFISFPEGEEDQNIALSAIQNVTTTEEKDEALSQAYSSGFVPLETRYAIKKLYTNLYNFALWLGRNKLSLSYQSILDNAQEDANLEIIPSSEVATLSASLSDLEQELWNQLFYNIVTKGSTTIRDIFIQLLIANNFLDKFDQFVAIPSEDSEDIIFTEEQQENFTRLANASLIIPKELIATKNDITETSLALSKTTVDYLAASLAVDKAKSRLTTYETALEEVKRAAIVYDKLEKTNYSEALATHQDAVTALKEAAVPTVQVLVDPTTGFYKKSEVYEELELPTFQYESGSELDLNNSDDLVLNQLSDDTKSLLTVKDFELYDTFDEIKVVLQENIKLENQAIINNTQETVKNVTIGGTTLQVNTESTTPYYSYKGSLQNVIGTSLSNIGMRLKVEDATNLSVTSSNYTITSRDGSTSFSNDAIFNYSLVTEPGYLYLRFFNDEKVALTAGDYIMEGSFTLSNGVSLTFYEDDFVVTYDKFEYVANIIGNCIVTEESTITEKPTDSGFLHGVTELGIADFRRVEQEVCCYVPGEVSHIENIMAREYKERSTRSLNVSESTTEQTSETEIENLTDTTTTERNEMHTEASSIVNQDNATNFGANASVSGSFPGGASYSAGTNYNTSSSNSTSNSNLQAQTYAQEVTERALERVVQKVSTKRTSRILKEFEENNTHGFDNRKGDEHVTGVYRWVDKIYKNTLVNYGKRLMYEFALPEPAKFFINSYLTVTPGEMESNLIIPVKPIHPADLNFGIKEAGELTESNYQILASLYNAEVNSLPSILNVGKAFSFIVAESSSSGEFGELAADSSEITIPEGYKAKYYEVQITESKEDDDGRGVQVLLAGKVCTLGQRTLLTTDQYAGEVSASFSSMGKHTGSVNINLSCVPTTEKYRDWQNETYKAIIDAYNERVQVYNDFMASQATGEEVSEEKQELSSQINRGIEKRELKRMAIDLMTHNIVTTTANHYQVGSSSKLLEDRSGLQSHMEVIKFFEQAFDWEIMAYTFYPYFYKTDWTNAFDYIEGNDQIFKAFLQSGMARSVVPVTPGFEDAVNWYMQTGEVWNGTGMVTDANDELYVSIAEEMQTVEGEVEGTWETRVPTSLTVLQAGSVALNESGLPCDPNCDEETLFVAGTSLITSEEVEEGVDYDIVGETNNVA